MPERLRVGVLFGGISSEREVSLESGRHVYHNLDPEKYEGIPIFMDMEGQLWEIPLKLLFRNTTRDIATRVEKEGERIPYEDLKKVVDFLFIALHGKYGEDGCLQGLLELQGIPYNGCGVLGSALGMDKWRQRTILAMAGVNVPGHMAVAKNEWEEDPQGVIGRVEEVFGFPCVVKPSREGCSTGLCKARDEAMLGRAIERAFSWDARILIEECLNGMEVTCTILGNDNPIALLPTETPPAPGHDYLTLEDKFMPGGAEMITPARLSPILLKKVQEEMVKAYKALGIKVYARIDGFVVGEKVIVTEANTLPGVTPSTCAFQQAAEAGMKPMRFIDRIIELSFQAHQDKIGPL
ncbi:MAG: D-alanine--D-alanine ligase [candidate division NC10 bacterium]|nr:D-alanine--D-alanine ligase [candidate division NC10 bacterium]